VAGYAGTSPLYGAYVAGLMVDYLSEHTSAARTEKLGDGHKVEPADFKTDTHHSLSRASTYPGTLPNNSSPSTIVHSPPIPDAVSSPNPSDAGMTLVGAFEAYISPLINRLLLPLFFASIGYSIPFIPLFRGAVIWRGIVYALLMVLGKAICGLWIVFWPSKSTQEAKVRPGEPSAQSPFAGWKGGVFLGMAMVARGEIGLLYVFFYSCTRVASHLLYSISQIAQTTRAPLLERDEFLIVTWAIVLCTIIGPVGVGRVISRWGKLVLDGGWD
jgi:Kef-type K+ transport system membrane component KefB